MQQTQTSQNKEKHFESRSRIIKANLIWSPNSSKILPVNCKFIYDSTPT